MECGQDEKDEKDEKKHWGAAHVQRGESGEW
jgi:hypothetical protein